MFVKHLQEYLDKFTEGQNGRRGNAVSDARIYIMTSKGYLEEIKRIEVHESNNPKDTSIRVVLKPNKEEKLILPPDILKITKGVACNTTTPLDSFKEGDLLRFFPFSIVQTPFCLLPLYSIEFAKPL